MEVFHLKNRKGFHRLHTDPEEPKRYISMGFLRKLVYEGTSEAAVGRVLELVRFAMLLGLMHNKGDYAE